MRVALDDMLWSVGELHRGIEALLVADGHDIGSAQIPRITFDFETAVHESLVNEPRAVGVEGSFQKLSKAELLAELSTRGPFVCVLPRRTPTGIDGSFLVALGEGLRCRVLTPQGQSVDVSPAELFDAVDAWIGGAGGALADALADLEGGREAVAQLSMRERFDGLWLSLVRYRRDGASPLVAQIDSQRGRRLAWGFAAAAVLQLAISVGAALTLGKAAVDGVVDRGRIMAWAMISLVSVPLSYWSASMLGALTILAGMSIKRRLLEGTFFIDDRKLRTQGYGASLAQLNEASVIERTNLAELFGLLTPLGTWLGAAWTFAQTPFAAPLLAVHFGMGVLVALLAFRITRAYASAYAQRLELTEDVVEKIVGHRTRAIQESLTERHGAEDRALAGYTLKLGRLDLLVVVSAATPRIFLLLTGAVLATAFVRGASAGDLLVSGVGIFLGLQSLSAMAAATEPAAGWVSAWRAIRGLFASGRTRERPHRDLEANLPDDDLPTVLAVSAVSFSYRDGGRQILEDAQLRVRRGERILLEGASGGGKTTLAKLVAGELRPSSGSVLVGGMDCSTIAESQWREIVASAPQFHENYVFSNSFAFNVDPRGGGFGQLTPTALAICNELGLDQVLSRMPVGSAQLLGETGWQLSHGERSRVFIARALLQGAKVVIFDESFGALDPITMERAVDCVRRHASTLLVIAHV